jgi:hypothetical protein
VVEVLEEEVGDRSLQRRRGDGRMARDGSQAGIVAPVADAEEPDTSVVVVRVTQQPL